MKEKRFTIILPLTSPGVTEAQIKNALVDMLYKSDAPINADQVCKQIQVWEHNKTHTCDGCGKERRDVKSCGKDANGDPDAPDLCFICRKEAQKGRHYDKRLQAYTFANYDNWDL